MEYEKLMGQLDASQKKHHDHAVEQRRQKAEKAASNVVQKRGLTDDESVLICISKYFLQ